MARRASWASRACWAGLWALAFGAVAACAVGQEPEGADDCVPGHQVSCACPDGEQGIQLCDGDGRFGECTGCEGTPRGWPGQGGGSWGSGAGASTATGGASGTSGTSGTGAGGSTEYTLSDCLFDTPRNGSEICDDSGFEVPASPPPGVLVCLEATGGVIYVATNTAIDIDGVSRCQGWENHGQNPWDHLSYIAQVTCDSAQKTLDVDVSAYAGQTLWFGAHDHPQGGGNGTTACIAIKK